VRPQLRQMLVVSGIGGHDRGHWRGHGPGNIRRVEGGREPFFRFLRTDEDETRGTAVRAGRPHLEQIIKLAQYVVRDGALQPSAVGARGRNNTSSASEESAILTAHLLPFRHRQ